METNSPTLNPDASFGVFNASSGTFVLPTLPFEAAALVPITGAETIHIHLEKHHQAYIDGANAILAPLEKRFVSAVDVIAFARDTDVTPLLEQAGQALNHAFFWTCQQAAGLSRPTGSLEIAINSVFTDFDSFIATALRLGKSRVGSGWIWLVSDRDGVVSLKVTEDAGTLLDDTSLVALLVCDIWEHAYYLDHMSDRATWIKGFFGQLADWSMAQSRYDTCLAMEPNGDQSVFDSENNTRSL
jgi:superoxide dismutase, Fe-Mn family